MRRSRRDGEGVDGPDGNEGDGGERKGQAEGGGPAGGDQTFDEAERGPVHHRKQEGGLVESKTIPVKP